MEGAVRLVGGCLFVEQDDLGERYLVYFSKDEVARSRDGLGYADSTYGAGDGIALPGGLAADSQPVPAHCRERLGLLHDRLVIANAAAMAKALKPYLDAATKVGGRNTRSRRTASSRTSGAREDLAAIREWARGQGIEVSDRGRIPAAVIAQYDAVN